MERESATLDEIARAANMDKALVKDSLIVGIQQNFVVGVEVERATSKSGSNPPVLTSYRIILQNIVVRGRFGRYTRMMEDKFEPATGEIVILLLQQGRMAVRSLIAQFIALDNTGDQLYRKQQALDIVRSLRDGKFLMDVPRANDDVMLPCRSKSFTGNMLDDSSDASSTRGRKRSASGTVLAGKKTASNSEPTSAAARAKRAAASGSMISSKASSSTNAGEDGDVVPGKAGAKRSGKKTSASSMEVSEPISLAPELLIYDEEDEAGPNGKKSASSASMGGRGSSSNSMMMEIDQPMASGASSTAYTGASVPGVMGLAYENDPTEVCLDYDRMDEEFAKVACVNFVSQKLDALAGGIFREMLEIQETSRTVSEERLYANLTDSGRRNHDPKVAAVPRHNITKYLDLMLKDKTEMLIKQTNGFMIDKPKIIAAVKQKMVESIVRDKFGPDSLRIFRLLIMKKLLEQKQVSELAMTPIKDTRDCLYKMLSSNIVHLQEVPRTSEHIPSKTFYLWAVRLPQVENILLMDMYKAYRNLHFRVAHNRSTHADLIAKKEEEDRITQERGEINKAYSRITDADEATLAELTTIEERLELAMSHLDESILTLEMR